MCFRYYTRGSFLHTHTHTHTHIQLTRCEYDNSLQSFQIYTNMDMLKYPNHPQTIMFIIIIIIVIRYSYFAAGYFALWFQLSMFSHSDSVSSVDSRRSMNTKRISKSGHHSRRSGFAPTLFIVKVLRKYKWYRRPIFVNYYVNNKSKC